MAALELKRHLGVNYDQRKSPRDGYWRQGGGRAACEVTGTRWVNVLLGNVKRAISGSYHAIRQSKYDRRKSLFGMRASTWWKQLTVSTADLTCARCCRDWCARCCSASRILSQSCAWRAIFMAEDQGESGPQKRIRAPE